MTTVMKHKTEEVDSSACVGASKQPYNNPDWEGFIYEHDSPYSQHNKPNENEKMPTPKRNMAKLPQSTDITRHTRRKQLQHNSKPLPKLSMRLPITTVRKPHSQQKSYVHSKSKHRALDKESLARNLTPYINPIASQRKRPAIEYPRVPIVRSQQAIINYGIILYRGMCPRTSNRYLTTLKDVDYSEPIAVGHNKDRLKQPLTFNSKFECGNLNYAIKSAQNEYDLYIRVDTNTQGHRQWFFFSVCNRKVQGNTSNTYHFNVNKFSKRQSLYRRGMTPYVFSKRDYQEALLRRGNKEPNEVYYAMWRQLATCVEYVKETAEEKNKYYILKFTYEFKYENDEVFFASCPPYSYSFLNEQIGVLMPNESIKSLTKTICGLNVPYIQIGQSKRYIIIIARSHPGQTSGSWVMHGILQWAKLFKDVDSRVSVIIVPMMNPDGVFMGNYRTGISGRDFNRSFETGKPTLFPEITALKKLIQQCLMEGEVLAFMDLHGHSILRNSFFYGPNTNSFSSNILRRLPEELAEASQLFKYTSCRFKNERDKVQTARVYFQVRHRILTLTLENSLGLKEDSSSRSRPINIADWIQLGKEIVIAIKEIVTVGKEKATMSSKIIAMNEETSFNPQPERHKSLRSKEKLDSHITRHKPFRMRKHSHRSNVDQKSYLQTEVSDLAPYSHFDPNATGFQSRFSNISATLENLKTGSVAVEEQENLTEGYDTDDNDEDSESQDLPLELLAPVHAAIETKDFPSETFRGNLQQKTSEEMIQFVMNEEKKNEKLQRITNGFRQVKFNTKRLSPNNKPDLREYYNNTDQTNQRTRRFDSYRETAREAGSPSLIGNTKLRWQHYKQSNDEQSSVTKIMTEISKELPISRRKKQQPKEEPMKRRKNTGDRVLNIEEQLDERVNMEIRERFTRMESKKDSIFGEKKIFEEVMGKGYLFRKKG